MEYFQAIFNQINPVNFLGKEIMAFLLFFIFVIFRKLFSNIILKIVFWVTKNKRKVKESKVYKTLNYYFVFLGLYLAIRMLHINYETLVKVDCYFRIICIILVTNAVNSFITKDAKWIKRYLEHQKNSATAGNFICKIIRGIVWIVSGYIIMKELGFDLSGLIAGFGLGGVILSLAAQDTVKSLLSGAIILTDKPFDIGDCIEIGTHKGTVIDMTFRSIRIKAIDNSIVTIPNSTITAECVVNWSRLQSRRLEFVLNLSMDTTSEKIKNLLEKIKLILRNNSEVLEDTIQVGLDEISSYSSDIKVVLYINEIDFAKFLKVKEGIYCDILQLVEIENIDLAYPTQTVYVKNTENELKKDTENT